MVSLSNAKTLKTGATAKSKRSDKAEIEIAGLEDVAAIDAVIKSLTALKKAKESQVKDAMKSYFVTTGAATKKRPENFRGIEAELMESKGLPVEEVVETVATLVINPEYLQDQILLAKVEQQLNKIKDIPDDFIMSQEGKSKKIVGETALDVLFAEHSQDAIDDLLSVVGVLAVKPTLKDDDITKAMEVVNRIVNPPKKAKKTAA
jgi:hypothetical protein